MSKKLSIIWVILLMIGVILIFVASYKGDDNGGNNTANSATPSLSGSVAPTKTPARTGIRTATPNPTPNPGPVNTTIGNLPAATCAVSGIITFTTPNAYQSTNAKIVYRNIDHPGRLILWNTEIKDDFNIGPNMFSGLKIPDGEEAITTTLKPNTTPYRQYTLTAKVTYGKFVNGNLEIRETNCSGETLVNIAY